VAIPHFTIDPERGKLVAATSAEGMIVSPQRRRRVPCDLDRLLARIDSALAECKRIMGRIAA
jgi:hypothetical protein